ncbi:MAG: efflux RND transporter permease subunit [Gemmataceae bacterium]
MFARFFIDRPIFAAVLSIVITLAGGIAVFRLPIAMFPSITPPTIQVDCRYPGASAQVVAETVAAPIEQQVNGVEGMMYMSSQCTNDGSYNLTVTFQTGVNLNMAQVLVQNRVSLAIPNMPDVIKQTGVTTRKRSPDILCSVNINAPDERYDQLFLSNFANIRLRDELSRLPGVSDVLITGQRDFSMRIWLDPQKLASRRLTAGDVVQALRLQNREVATGKIGQPPVKTGQPLEITLDTLGRLSTVEQYENVVLKTGSAGQVVQLKDVARVELGGKNLDVSCFLDGRISVGLPIFQLPDANALDVADTVKAKMAELQKDFPDGMQWEVQYDTTPYIRESIHEVYKTLAEAIGLVAIVVLLFLQSWRSAIIPLVAVPVAIVGTFAAMALGGFSLNNLTLFGLVLAIGIVVDDAIVVVEAVEHHIETGLSPYDATVLAMKQVSGPVVAVALVLSAVFIPCAFISGITGSFFRQFALTIAVSTVISAFNSLTLSPALAARLLRPKGQGQPKRGILGAPFRVLSKPFTWFFAKFNAGFASLSSVYLRAMRHLLRRWGLVLGIYGVLVVLTTWGFRQLPTGFIPSQDMGYLLVNVQLPDAASTERTLEVMRKCEKIALETPGVGHVVTVAGQSFLLSAFGSNFGSQFVILKPYDERRSPGMYGEAIAANIRRRFAAEIMEAAPAIFAPPPVRGVGRAGGFKLMLEDRGGVLGPVGLQEQTDHLVEQSKKEAGLTTVFTVFRANAPQLFADIDRKECMTRGVFLRDVFDTLQVFLGSLYVNDFNLFGRTWQVVVQADAHFRDEAEDVKRLEVRNNRGEMLRLGTLANVRDINGPPILTRYNMYAASAIQGNTLPGVSSGQGIEIMKNLTDREKAPSLGYEWSEMAYLELQAGNTALMIFFFAVIMVFLVLAAQYESWALPLAVILVVPMCLLSAITGVWIAKQDINIFTQIGFVVLVGLASKNAILIVEFAKKKREEGLSITDAAIEACKLRLRPIIMTSMAFVLGVTPLLISSGAGAEMRRTLGTAVFSGMLGVTFFGLLLTPVFFSVVDRMSEAEILHSVWIRRISDTVLRLFSMRWMPKILMGRGKGTPRM